MWRGSKRFAPLLGLLVLVVLLAGCGASAVQGTKYTAFKDSTAALAQDTRASYEGVQGLWEELTAECLAIPNNNATYMEVLAEKEIPCSKGKGKDAQVKTFENPQPRLAARLQALDALARYAAMLNTLATTDYAAGVDASTAKLTASLDNLQAALAQGGVPPAPKLETAASVISTVVAAVAKSYVEGKRKEALSKALTDTQKSIQDLADNLELDSVQISTLAESYSGFYVGLAQGVRPKVSLERIKAYDVGVLKVYKTGKTLKAAFIAQGKMLKLLPAAHANLLTSLNDPKTGLEQLEEFVAAAEQVLAIMKQLRTN